MRNRSPDNLPQHIPAPFIRRQHSIGNQKRSRPRVIRDDPERSRRLMRCLRGDSRPRLSRRAKLGSFPRQLRRPLDQRRKQIRLVIRNHALQHRTPTAPAPCRYQSMASAAESVSRWIPVKLHEHQVPDFHIPPAFASRTRSPCVPGPTPRRPCRSEFRCTGRTDRYRPSARSYPSSPFRRCGPSERPVPAHRSYASASRSTPFSPLKIVTYNLSFAIPNHAGEVISSHA